jgi:hypothetical protein
MQEPWFNVRTNAMNRLCYHHMADLVLPETLVQLFENMQPF